MKKAMRRTNWREIRQSKTRFFSILGIIFLGVAFYVGLRATGPDMLKTASSYYQKQNLADTRVVSSLGITATEIKKIEEVEGIKAEGRYFQDVNLSKEDQVFRIFSYDSKQTLNRVVVTKGRLPKNSEEIVLDDRALEKGYKLNQRFDISADETQKHKGSCIVSNLNGRRGPRWTGENAQQIDGAFSRCRNVEAVGASVICRRNV